MSTVFSYVSATFFCLDLVGVYGAWTIAIAANRGFFYSVLRDEIRVFSRFLCLILRWNLQGSWATFYCSASSSCLQLYWARLLLRKWFNISATESDHTADTDSDDDDDDSAGDSETKGQFFFSFSILLKSGFTHLVAKLCVFEIYNRKILVSELQESKKRLMLILKVLPFSILK